MNSLKRWSLAAGLCLAATVLAAADPPAILACSEPPAAAASCGKHGTSVDFKDSPTEAARLAREQEKLVFVLHVSGHFEDPGIT
jgi:hypothetical protein